MLGVQDVENIDDITSMVTCGQRHIKFGPSSASMHLTMLWIKIWPKKICSRRSPREMARSEEAALARHGVLKVTQHLLGERESARCQLFVQSGRVICGMEQGDLYLFEQPVDTKIEARYNVAMKKNLHYGLPRQLIGIIPRAHDGPVATI